MISEVPVENMSYTTQNFELRSGKSLAPGYHPNDDRVDDIHPTQKGKRIKLILFFWIPAAVEEGCRDMSCKLPRLASVRVPRGCPIFKLRGLIKHVENELSEVYGKAKRAEIVLIADEYTEEWEYSHHLPMSNVTYA